MLRDEIKWNSIKPSISQKRQEKKEKRNIKTSAINKKIINDTYDPTISIIILNSNDLNIPIKIV